MTRLGIILGLNSMLCLFSAQADAKTLYCDPVRDGSYSGYLGKVIIVSKAEGGVKSVVFPSQVETEIYQDCRRSGTEYRCRLPGKYVACENVVLQASSLIAFVVSAEDADL